MPGAGVRPWSDTCRASHGETAPDLEKRGGETKRCGRVLPVLWKKRVGGGGCGGAKAGVGAGVREKRS